MAMPAAHSVDGDAKARSMKEWPPDGDTVNVLQQVVWLRIICSDWAD